MRGRYITGGESCSPLVSSLFVVVCGRYMIPTRAGGVGSGRLLSPKFSSVSFYELEGRVVRVENGTGKLQGLPGLPFLATW